MLTADVRKLFQREAQGLGQQDGSRYHRQALRVFEGLRFPGGEVEVVGELQVARQSVLALAAWSSPRVRRVFGLDGGSSRTMVFRNGTVACANQAVLACEHSLDLAGLPLEGYRTLSWVTYSRKEHQVPGARCEQHERVTLWRLHLSDLEIEEEDLDRIQPVVKAMADVASEPSHLLRLAPLMGLGEGDLVFLDGRLYPLRLFYHLLSGRGPDWKIHLDTREDWERLLQFPLDVVHRALERGFTVVALNKNPRARTLLHFGAFERKPPWHNDRQWISALFEHIPLSDLGYTNWFVQALHPPQGGGDEPIDLFDELGGLEKRRPVPDYHVAFFFVYDPRVRAALRVEVPRAVLERWGGEPLRLLVLSQVARGPGGVPNAVRIADAEARITPEERAALQDQIGLTPDWEYDHSRGAPR